MNSIYFSDFGTNFREAYIACRRVKLEGEDKWTLLRRSFNFFTHGGEQGAEQAARTLKAMEANPAAFLPKAKRIRLSESAVHSAVEKLNRGQDGLIVGQTDPAPTPTDN
jgi:hypothetical protein